LYDFFFDLSKKGVISAEGAIEEFRKAIRISQELKEEWSKREMETIDFKDD
jgi:hypothetical protein